MIFLNIKTMTDWIDLSPLTTQVMDSIGFNNFFTNFFI
jgi:hypothetical protein